MMRERFRQFISCKTDTVILEQVDELWCKIYLSLYKLVLTSNLIFLYSAPGLVVTVMHVYNLKD